MENKHGEQNRSMLLAVLAAGHAIKHIFNSGFYIILPELQITLRLSNTALGTLSTIRHLTAGIVNLPAGYLSDRYMNKFTHMLTLVMILMGVFQFLVGRSTTYWEIVIFSSLMIITISFWHPAAISAISRAFSDRRGFAISIHGTGASIGEAIGPILTGLFLSIITWQWLSQWSLIPAVISGILVWTLLKRETRPNTIVSFSTYTKAFANLTSNRSLISVLIIAAGYGAAHGTLFTFLPIYLRSDLSQSSWAVGGYLSLAQVIGIAAQPLMGYSYDRLGPNKVIIPSLIALGMGLLGLYCFPTGIPFLVILLATGTVLFPVMALLVAAASDMVAENIRATAISMVYLTTVIATGISPVGAGFLADEYGVRSTFLLASLLCFASGCVGIITIRYKK